MRADNNTVTADTILRVDAIMAMITRPIPLANYSTGTVNIDAINIPDSATELYMEFARCTTADQTIWPNSTTTLQVDFEGSTDGVNWTYAGGFGVGGGIHILLDGSESQRTTFRAPLPPLTGRQLRGTITIANGPLRSHGTVELRD